MTDYLTAQLGLSFAGDRLADLEKNIDALVDAFNFEQLEEFIEWMVHRQIDQEDIEILAQFLTVGETYFFRDPKVFAVLEQEIVPALIKTKIGGPRFLRIWSAGCCTGEEPYSVAILLDQLIDDIDDWQIKLIATDINASFLEKAEHGVFSEWSFRATERELRDKYFTPLKKGGYRISSRIKRMVSFGWLNLADLESLRDSSLSCMDMIFCRNVFIYFHQATILNVMARLHDNLLDGGYLFVGPNELPATRPPGFQAIHRPGAIILRKSSDPDPATLETTSGAPPIFTAFEPIAPTASYAIPGLDEAKKAYDNFDYKRASEVLLDHSGSAKDADALVLLAKCYANLGDTKSALHWCEQAIKANPLNPSLYYLQATIWQENGDTKQAISSLRQALGVSSEFVLAEFTLGNLLKQSGQEKEASDCFAAALKLLQRYDDGDIIPDSDGTTAQGLKVIVSSLLAETARPS